MIVNGLCAWVEQGAFPGKLEGQKVAKPAMSYCQVVSTCAETFPVISHYRVNLHIKHAPKLLNAKKIDSQGY